MRTFSFFFFSRCKMTPGPGKASVQSPFVSSSAAAWKGQTSHGREYMLVHTKPITYLLLLRSKSLVNSFPLGLGPYLSPLRFGEGARVDFPCGQTAMKVSLVSSAEAREGGGGRGGRGGQHVTRRDWAALPSPCCHCCRLTR